MHGRLFVVRRITKGSQKTGGIQGNFKDSIKNAMRMNIIATRANLTKASLTKRTVKQLNAEKPQYISLKYTSFKNSDIRVGNKEAFTIFI